MGNTTYKDLFTLTSELISRKLGYQNSKTFRNQLDRNDIGPSLPNAQSDLNAAEVIASIQQLLSEALPGFIMDGLQVYAYDPPGPYITIKAGKGSKGGALYKLNEDVTLLVPFDGSTSTFYVYLYRDTVRIDKNLVDDSLLIAKIIVPVPGQSFKIYNKREDRDDDWQAYLIQFQEFKLYQDNYGNLEEDSIDLFRDNIGPILADNIIGNIRLSENLKITNTQGTLELDSRSMKLLSSDGDLLAKFNKDGTFYYDANGVEIARFAVDSAKIGNILITTNSVQSEDYQSETRGFKIQDSGFAEFGDVRVRGRISSSVFEYDRISAVGGKLFVGNSTVLASVVTATDTTITVDTGVFIIGDVLRIKDGVDEEYMLITAVDGTGLIYTVTRDTGDQYASGVTLPIWNTGTAIVSTGNANSGYNRGYILLDAVSQYAPFMDIVQRLSSTPTDVEVKVRLGRLDGISDACFSPATLSGYGLYSENAYLRGVVTASTICSSTLFSTTICSSNLYSTIISSSYINTTELTSTCICSSLLCSTCICSSSLCSTCIYASVIESSTFQTAAALQRLIFDSSGLRGYDATCHLAFCLSTDGSIMAENIRLQDPNCICCYSFLSAGALKFHDELGDVPYVKRIKSGTANTGQYVCLLGWRTAPEVIVSPKTLYSYNSGFAQCQQWNLYHDNVTFYCNSSVDYGYCFQVHAALQLASAQGAETIKNAAFGACYTSTQSNVCSSIQRLSFQLFCHAAAPANWCYGCLCFVICYRCLGCVTWQGSCAYTYLQPHADTSQMQTTYTCSFTLNLPTAQCWEFMTCQTGLSWVDSGIASGSISCFLCTRAITVGTGCAQTFLCICSSCSQCNCCIINAVGVDLTVAGAYPSNVFCTYISYCWCSNTTCNLKVCHQHPFLGSGTCLCYHGYSRASLTAPNHGGLNTCCNNFLYCKVAGAGCSFTCECNISWNTTTGTDNCHILINQDYTKFCLCVETQSCFIKCISSFFNASTCSVANACFFAGNLYHCYCTVTGGAASCTLQCVYSICDTYSTQCILDSAGVVSWLAVAYT